jgi:hypothetical protein
MSDLLPLNYVRSSPGAQRRLSYRIRLIVLAEVHEGMQGQEARQVLMTPDWGTHLLAQLWPDCKMLL